MPREMKYSGIEWIGMIPNNWNTGRLQWCLEEINVSNNPIQTEDILSLTIESGVIPYAEKGNQGNKAKEDCSQYKIAFPDTLVVNSMNVIIGAVGISKYYGCVSPVYYVFKATADTNIRYILYLFTNVGFQKEMRKYAKGILEIRLRISASDLLKLLVPKPSFAEQKKIVNFLDTECSRIDSIIEQTRASIEEYRRLKRSIVSEAVTKGIFKDRKVKETGIEWIRTIPEKWTISKVKYVATSVDKGNGITKEDVDAEGDIQCVRYGEIYTKYEGSFIETFSRTREEKIESAKYVSKGDILFTCTGELVEEIGKNVVYMGNLPCLAGGDIIVLKHNQDPVFLNYSLNSDYSQLQKSYGKTKLKVVHISAGEIGNIVIALPPVEEQRIIGEYLEKKSKTIDNLIEQKQKVINQLESLKKSLIYEYVTGKKEAPVE